MICLTRVNGFKTFVDPAAIKSVAYTGGGQKFYGRESDDLTIVSGQGFSPITVTETVEEILNARHLALFGELSDDEAADYIADLEDDVAVYEDDAETLSLQLGRANEMILGLKDKLDLYVTAVDAIEGSLEKFFNGKATSFLNSNELSHSVVDAIAALDEALEEFGEDE